MSAGSGRIWTRLPCLTFTCRLAVATAVFYGAVDELHRDAKLSEVQGRALAAFYDPPRVIEAIFTVGQYGLICRIANSCEIPLDPGLAGFPERS